MMGLTDAISTFSAVSPSSMTIFSLSYEIDRQQNAKLGSGQCCVAFAHLKIRLCAFGSRSDGLCLVLDVVPGRVGEVELRALVVEASDEQRRAERSGHLVLFSVLPEAQCEIARALGERLHSHGLVVHEAVILALDSRVVHQRPKQIAAL
eukprot:scaffold2177_cov272-Pinguiococcus_pyrenoidosus.AAC.10